MKSLKPPSPINIGFKRTAGTKTKRIILIYLDSYVYKQELKASIQIWSSVNPNVLIAMLSATTPTGEVISKIVSTVG